MTKQAGKEDRAAHSPIPWKIIFNRELNPQYSICAKDGNGVADVYGWKNNKICLATQKSNALLLVTAPDLLAACKALVEYADTPQNQNGDKAIEAFKIAEKAIAAAEGRDE